MPHLMDAIPLKTRFTPCTLAGGVWPTTNFQEYVLLTYYDI